ncbi:MAG: maleylpyruvate isomerase N-terminal domain-containing protein [Actinomycetota bacterium]
MARAHPVTTPALEELRIELAPAADALAQAARRLTELLRGVPDPAAPARGLSWTIGELTAHVAARTSLFAEYVSGTATPEGAIANIAANNQRQIDGSRDVPFETQVELIGASVAAFVETTKGRLGSDPYPWYSGIELDVATGTGVALAELLVHGYDVARTIRRPWPIGAEDARRILRASLVLAPHYVDPIRTAGRRVTYRILVRGGPRVRVRIDDGGATLEGAEGPADCSIRAEPVALTLVSYGRMSRWRAAATGRLLAGGRAPWKALAFSSAFRRP